MKYVTWRMLIYILFYVVVYDEWPLLLEEKTVEILHIISYKCIYSLLNMFHIHFYHSV